MFSSSLPRCAVRSSPASDGEFLSQKNLRSRDSEIERRTPVLVSKLSGEQKRAVPAPRKARCWAYEDRNGADGEPDPDQICDRCKGLSHETFWDRRIGGYIKRHFGGPYLSPNGEGQREEAEGQRRHGHQRGHRKYLTPTSSSEMFTNG